MFKVEIEQNEELSKDLYKVAVDDVVANTYTRPTFKMRWHIVMSLLFTDLHRYWLMIRISRMLNLLLKWKCKFCGVIEIYLEFI